MSEFQISFTVKTEEAVDISEIVLDFAKQLAFDYGRWTNLSVAEVRADEPD